MRRLLILLLRLGLAAALIAYVVSQIEFRDTLVLRAGDTEREEKGRIGLGPLTRIEVGERKYARSRTVPVPPL